MFYETFGEQIRERRMALFEITLDDNGARRARIELVHELSNECRHHRLFGAVISEPARASHDGSEAPVETYDAGVSSRRCDGQDRKRHLGVDPREQIAGRTLDEMPWIRLDCGPPLILSTFLQRHS